jgi:hypothetical protein
VVGWKVPGRWDEVLRVLALVGVWKVGSGIGVLVEVGEGLAMERLGHAGSRIQSMTLRPAVVATRCTKRSIKRMLATVVKRMVSRMIIHLAADNEDYSPVIFACTEKVLDGQENRWTSSSDVPILLGR